MEGGYLARQLTAAGLRRRAENIEAGVKQPLPPQHVYVIRCQVTGLAKIGIAANPQSRLAVLRIGSPTKLELFAVLPGGRALEKELHDRYAAHWSHGEWFSLPPDALEALADMEREHKARTARPSPPITDPDVAHLVAASKVLDVFTR